MKITNCSQSRDVSQKVTALRFSLTNAMISCSNAFDKDLRLKGPYNYKTLKLLTVDPKDENFLVRYLLKKHT